MSGCLGGIRDKGRVVETQQPQFRPERFFEGSTHGEGVMWVRTKADRRFLVNSTGHSEGDGTFVLDQTVTYDNGRVETRSFRLRHVGEDEYVGTLTGASGVVRARTMGNAFHVQYTIGHPHVTMEQWIYLQPDGRTSLNRATVRILGIPVARISETIARR